VRKVDYRSEAVPQGAAGLASALRLAYVSTESIEDPHSLSGTTRSIGLALGEICRHVEYVSPLDQRLSCFDRMANELARRFGTSSRLTMHRWRNATFVAQQAKKSLARLAIDCIFSPSCIPIAALDDDRPIFLYSDATVPGLCGYYGQWKNVLRSSLCEAMDLERAALRRCRRVFLASEWARASALDAYGLDPKKVVVVPRGANVEKPPTGDQIATSLWGRSLDAPRILVVGRDWHRKGMDVACETVQILRQRALPATLTLVGAIPPKKTRIPDYVTVLPFLSRRSESAAARLKRCFLEATLFLLPTRAEAMGIVLAEAAAYGLPVVARNTGGTSAAVIDGETGVLVAELAGPEDFAAAVQSVVASRMYYDRLAINARRQYESVLNWSACANRLVKEMEVSLTQ
jgi:glycosyltransferase involved in cell wall biosynthesis